MAAAGAAIGSAAQSANPRRGLSGHLTLCCGVDSTGQSYLRQQSFRAPIHLSKPHLDEGVLVVNVVNPTAGLLSGDRVCVQAHVENGARLLLTAPSASRAHRMHEGHAAVNQQFTIARGGWLESWPEIFIPQGGTRYRQQTRVNVEEGGELLLFEMLAPGRVAFGEAFAYESLDWETDIWLDRELIARERYQLTPANGSLDPIRAQFPQAYYASCFVVSPRLTSESECWEAIDALHGAEVWIGCSALARGGWTIKLVTNGSIALRNALSQVRQAVYEALGQRVPAMRRT